MTPCIVVERLEGNQQCNRDPVGEHAQVQVQDTECGYHEQQEVNEKWPKPRNNQSHNHDSVVTRQHPLIYTVAGPIHPVHDPLWLPVTEAMTRKDSHFCHFDRVSSHWFQNKYTHKCVRQCLIPPVLLLVLYLGLQTTLHYCLGPYQEEKETFPTSYHYHPPSCPEPHHCSAVHYMWSNLICQSTHRKTYSLNLPTGCHFFWKLLPTNRLLVWVSPTESHFVWVLPTESCFCRKLLTEKFKSYRVTHKKMF